MNNLEQQTQSLAQAFGRPSGKQIKRPPRAKLDPKVLANYMPVMGRARAVKLPSPESMAEGVNAFKGMMAQRRAGMIKEAQQGVVQSDMARNAKVLATRAKRVFQNSNPESRSLARIQHFMVSKGKSMGNSFKF